MSKYEIMLIVDINSNESEIKAFLNELFDGKLDSFEKMKITKLAYPINNITTASYYLSIIQSPGDKINEFKRRCKLNKEIIRHLIINLDTEIGLNSKKKPRPPRPPRPIYKKREFGSRPPYNPNNRRPAFDPSRKRAVNDK